METLLHYVWKHRLYVSDNLKTVEGVSLEVIDPGMGNSDAGPDFFNAKIKLDNQLWVGNIEIHTRASDWNKHRHDKDKAYDSVVLHVVESCDQITVKDSVGRSIPQWILSVPEKVKENYDYLHCSHHSIPCLGQLKEIPAIYLADWKDFLLMERLERKTQHILELLKLLKNDWNEVFYQVLARNFGFSVNNDVFERLAKSLPLKYILQQQDSILQVEALFLGQAGLLTEDIPEADDYYIALCREYRFLVKKYKLRPLESHLFKSLRIRPLNFPHIKIVQLAGIIRNQSHLFSSILQMKRLNQLQSLFTTQIHPYWQTHYRFGKESSSKNKVLGMASVLLLIINTVVPVLLAYGKQKNVTAYTETALSLLESMKPEDNFIICLFQRGGIKCTHAGDSQALIQLKHEYCDKKKCIFCRIGHKLLSR